MRDEIKEKLDLQDAALTDIGYYYGHGMGVNKATKLIFTAALQTGRRSRLKQSGVALPQRDSG